MLQTELRSAIVVQAEDGELWNVLGTPMRCKVRSEQTDGAYAVVENIIPPQAGPPAHVHHNEDEIFYVVEGEFEIRCGDEIYHASAGDLAVLPRNVPHAFRNIGEREGKVHVTITPGGFERFFEEVSEQIRTLPPDVEKLTAIARRYNVEFVR